MTDHNWLPSQSKGLIVCLLQTLMSKIHVIITPKMLHAQLQCILQHVNRALLLFQTAQT